MSLDAIAALCACALLVPAALLVRAELEARYRRRAREEHLAWWESHRPKPENVYDITPALKRAANRRR